MTRRSSLGFEETAGGPIVLRVITNNWLTHRTIVRTLNSSRGIRVLAYQRHTSLVLDKGDSRSVCLLDRLALPARCLETLRLDGESHMMLLGDCTSEEMCRFLLLGIQGFIPYREFDRRLIKAIEVVASGRLYVPTQLFREYVAFTQRALRARLENTELLTPRQLQILTFLERSYANKEISSALRISENTVKFHLAKLFSKLGVHDRHQLAELSRSGAYKQAPYHKSPTSDLTERRG